MNYDPNLMNGRQMSKKIVHLIFGKWEYRAEMTVAVHGNTGGLSVMRSAVAVALDLLSRDAHEIAYINLRKQSGELLEDHDEDEQEEEWLEEMLISAEIIDIRAD